MSKLYDDITTGLIKDIRSVIDITKSVRGWTHTHAYAIIKAIVLYGVVAWGIPTVVCGMWYGVGGGIYWLCIGVMHMVVLIVWCGTIEDDD